MFKKAIVNLSVEGVIYEKGKIYKEEDIAHLDQSNFESTIAPTEVPTPGTDLEELHSGDVKNTDIQNENTNDNQGPSTNTDSTQGSTSDVNNEVETNIENKPQNTDADVLE